MLLPVVLGLLVLTIIALSILWGWRNGSLLTTEQDLYDIEFDRIVRRVDPPRR